MRLPYPQVVYTMGSRDNDPTLFSVEKDDGCIKNNDYIIASGAAYYNLQVNYTK